MQMNSRDFLTNMRRFPNEINLYKIWSVVRYVWSRSVPTTWRCRCESTIEMMWTRRGSSMIRWRFTLTSRAITEKADVCAVVIASPEDNNISDWLQHFSRAHQFFYCVNLFHNICDAIVSARALTLTVRPQLNVFVHLVSNSCCQKSNLPNVHASSFVQLFDEIILKSSKKLLTYLMFG